MATVERTVELIFSGDDRVSGVMKGISGSLGKLDDLAQTVTAPLARVTDGVLAADAALVALGGTLAAVAIKQAGTFSDGFAEITTLIDATDVQLEGFRSDVLAYGRDSTQSIEDINGAVYTAISAGTDWQQSLELLAQAEQLATAGKADLEATTRLLASTLNAYGADVQEVTRYSDVFFTTVKDGQTTIPEMADNLSKVTSIAALAGVPIEELASALAALTAGGVDTANATTQLRSVIQSILDPGNEAAATAERLGLEFDAAALNSRGLAGVLEDVQRATGGNVVELQALFPNIRAFAGAATLAADESGVFAKALRDTEAAAGATAAASKIMEDQFTNANTRMVNNIRATLIQTGLPLLDQYVAATQAIGDAFAAVGISIDAGTFDPVFDAVESAGDDLVELIAGIADALPDALADVDFGPVLDAVQSFGAALIEIFGVIDPTQPEQLAAGLQATVDTIASLISATEGIAQAFEPVLDALLAGIEEFNALDPTAKVDIGERFLGVAKLIQEAGLLIGGALVGISEAGADMRDGFDVVIGAIQTVWGSLSTSISLGASLILEAVTTIAKGLNAITFGQIPGLDDAVVQLERFTQVAVEDFWRSTDQVNDGLDRMVGGLKGEAAAAAEAEKATRALATATNDAAAPADTYAGELDTLSRVLQATADDLNDQVGASEDAADAVGVLAKTAPDAAGGVDQLGTAAETAGGQLGAAAAESEDFKLAIAKLDADLKAKQFQLIVDLQTAQLQADTQRVVAAFDSIGIAIDDTSDTLLGLYGALANAPNVLIFNQIQQQIADENRRREEALRLQRLLTQAQIDNLQARTQILQQGGGLIQVDASGVEPALEAVMWNILEKVQLRVNQAAADFLLGV